MAIEELSVTGEELRSQTDELASARQTLEAERHRYQELFESAPVAYVVTDPLARVREANRAAAALLGLEPRFLAGRPLAAYVAASDRWRFRSMVGRLHRGEEERVREWPLRFRRRGGGVVSVAATVEPVDSGDGEPQGLRWLLRQLEPEETPRPVLPVELAVAQDGARRNNPKAPEDLDPVSDLDGAVQVQLDAGVRLLEADGTGLMLADSKGRLCAVGGSDEAALACPIGLYGGPVGVLLLASATPRTWTDVDVTAAEAYAAVLAALLEVAARAQRGRPG